MMPVQRPLLAGLAALAVALPAAAAPRLMPAAKPEPGKSAAVTAGKTAPAALVALAKAEETCVVQTINCGQTIQSTLTTQDCQLTDGTFFDVFQFSGQTGQQVTIDLQSDDFDAFLFLVNPQNDVDNAILDNDGGTGSDARIVFTLDQTGTWTIAPNNFEAVTGDPGDYTLSLACTNAPPPDGPPAAPSDLTATPLNSTEVGLEWTDNADDEDQFRVEVRESGGSFFDIGSVPANSEAADVVNLDPGTTYDFRVRARNSAGNSAFSNVATATTPEEGPGCTQTDTALCLQNDRFRVEVDWTRPPSAGGDSGVGIGTRLTDETGYFYFFNMANVETVVKVLNGCAQNLGNRYWVFAAGLTNVEVVITVTDTSLPAGASGRVKTYTNPQGQAFQPIQDTSAFATCP